MRDREGERERERERERNDMHNKYTVLDNIELLLYIRLRPQLSLASPSYQSSVQKELVIQVQEML